MTKDTFVKIVCIIIESKGVAIHDSKRSKLNALGREYERRSVSIEETIEKIKGIFSSDYQLDRHAYSEIQRQLERSV